MRSVVGATFAVAVLTTMAWAEPPPKAAAGKAKAAETITSKSPQAIAAFRKGRELFEAQRRSDSIASFKKALSLDPDFALAAAYLGGLTPGTEGDALLDKAVTLAAKLPEAERLRIEILAALRKGDLGKVDELSQKLVAVAPGDWRAHHDLAQRAMAYRKYDDAIAHEKQALAANPKATVVYNTLAYSYALQRKWDDAIAAAKKQADLLPREPNPQDTYGEVLLWAGKFPEAEAAFLKATKLEAAFSAAWQGVAMARYYRGDWAGGDDALAKQKQAAPTPQDKVDADLDIAWARLAEGKLPEALAAVDSAEKEAQAAKLPAYAFV